MMRLQKFLARAGVASRRHAEELIVAGRVMVNGQPAELGCSVDPGSDEIRVDGGAPVRLAEGDVTIMLHKPAGYVTTMDDPQGRATVADLVPADRFTGLFPVGRLDRDTTFFSSRPTASLETRFCIRAAMWRNATLPWSKGRSMLRRLSGCAVVLRSPTA